MKDIISKILGILLAIVMIAFLIILSPFIYLYRLIRNLRLPNKKDKALLLAIQQGSEAEIKEAIATGANLNRWYSNRQIDYIYDQRTFWSLLSPFIIADDVVTPLIIAITQPTPSIGCIVIMLEHGANLLDRNPLIYAIRADQPEIINILIRYGAQINPSIENAWSPLLEAIYENNTALVTILLENGAQVNQENGEVGLPLSFALSFSDIDPVIIEELLNHGADTTPTNSIGKTALELAKETGNDTIIALVEKSIAKKDGKE